MKRVLSILLALTLLMGVVALTACGGTNQPPEDLEGTGGGTQGTTESTLNTDPNSDFKDPRPGFENVDFGGKTFKFCTPLVTSDGWADYEVYADEDSEGILDASIIERNDILFEHYNCFVEVEDFGEGTLANDFATGQSRIDVVGNRYNLGSVASSDYYNFHTLGIDLKQPWWDQGFIEDVTVDGKLYAILGAFSLTSFDATWVMFFNKTVLENTPALAGYDPYEFVKNNEWTLDKFFEMVKKAGNEDGDSVMTPGSGDVFGLVHPTTGFGIRGLYFGAGQSYVTKTNNKDGSTTFSHSFTDAAVAATDTIIDIVSHEYVQDMSYTVCESQMRGGLTLFTPEVLRMASFFAGKQGASTDPVDIGIVPHPKLSSAQAEYKHNVDNHTIYMCVPTTCTDLERIKNFLELYEFHSYYTVYNDYLNLYKYNYTTDVDAAAMVDTILQTRTFDLGYQLNWGQVDTTFLSNVKNGENAIATVKGKLSDAILEGAKAYKEKLATLK
ncbi:MAG: hypothetical protein IJ021_00460 [Clostridia bacterium]|nr:hypothetical protein [Clostridia bacterium]